MMFQNRCLIEGTLTTRSPLHIGTGEVTPRVLDQTIAARDQARVDRARRHGRDVPEQRADSVDVAEVATAPVNGSGRTPVITGTAMKNLLCRALSDGGAPQPSDLLGSVESGSRVTCWDARATASLPTRRPPHWDPNRLTGVASFVSIERRTRTAAAERLFHVEYVPAGVSFSVQIGAENLEHDGPNERSELVRLLAALERAGRPANPIALGAHTAAGWGRLAWQTTALRMINRSDVGAWVASRGPRTCGHDATMALPDRVRRALCDAATKLAEKWGAAASGDGVELRLAFSSHFLVNDPSGCVADGAPDHTPLLDPQGHLMLPGSSLHGALRAQAERILRTIGYQDVCTPDTPCGPVVDISQVKGVCFACRLFGTTGWRSPLMVTDFSGPIVSDEDLFQQEFVALDRFTGGGSDRRKFNARSAWRPVLTGRVRIDRARLTETGVAQALQGLLLFALRDLAEGDVPLGFGAAKGYGACSIDGFNPRALSDALGFRDLNDSLKALTSAR